MRTACKKDHFKPSFSRQKRPPGVAQRSGAKSGAKRLDFSSNQHASASNQARPNVFTLKALSVSASTQPLNPRNILIKPSAQRTSAQRHCPVLFQDGLIELLEPGSGMIRVTILPYPCLAPVGQCLQ